ncbi:MAG: ATP-binding protein [Dissulfurimicrobium sp.]|uniref:sensor histidine kinase n=1 Tax=Dissulfurimicrobium sp. TaxID=2022436 RepID=UPI003D0A7465
MEDIGRQGAAWPMDHVQDEVVVLCRSRIKLLLDLALKLNSTFLKARNLDEIFQAVLVGITAGDGLGFNRAFLILLNEDKKRLEGRFAIGPADATDANRIWSELSQRHLSLFEILEAVKEDFRNGSRPINQLVKEIRVPLSDAQNVLMMAMTGQKAVRIGEDSEGHGVSEIRKIINSRQFAIVPIVTDEKMYGVIIADNFVTGAVITDEDMDALHLFATLASIAVCKTNMCERLEGWINQLKRLNDDVERNKDLLVEAERLNVISRMTDQLYHGIKNPLMTLGGMARMLKKRLNDPDLVVYAETIVRNAERLERILRDVFDLSRPSDAAGLKLEKVKLGQLIESTFSLFNRDVERLGIKVKHYNAAPELELKLDKEGMGQAFLNIFKNSIDAMPDGGLLAVSVASRDGMVEIRVTDTGLGVARGHLRQVGEPFFTTKPQGAGLGLSLAKRTISAHGGTFSIEGNRFRGATVIVRLPVIQD